MKALIIAGGKIDDYCFYTEYIKSADFIICADRGAEHAKKFGIVPDIIVGDFDSANLIVISEYEKMGVKVIRFNPEKDATDTEIAVNYSLEAGAEEVTIIAALGSRMDHSLANIFILKNLLEKGINSKIVNEKNTIFLVNNKIKIEKTRKNISLIPLTSEVNGISTYGLKYKLCNGTIAQGFSIGISNEFIDDAATIAVEKGILIVILSDND